MVTNEVPPEQDGSASYMKLRERAGTYASRPCATAPVAAPSRATARMLIMGGCSSV